jgi:ubiquinone biosynthesis protein COQ4
VEDPDDTAHVFTIVSALAGRTPERLHRRFTGSAEGRRLLEAKPSLLSVLADRERLRAMPEGSLGRAYLTFMEREQITAEGLVDASLAGGRPDVPEDEQFVAERLRDSHDLWHAVTGYQGDVKGEAAILAFSLAQTGNPGLLAIVLLGIAHTRSLDFTAMVAGGFARGLHARDLLTVHWESLLALPVEEVRWRLGVRPAPEYEPLRTSELRAQGMLRPRAA